MKSVAMTALAGGVLALFGTGTVTADDMTYGFTPGYRSHGRVHDELEHRQFHRQLGHREAHRNPLTPWQHGRLHDELDHDAYHDRLDHRSYHRVPRYSRFGYGGHGYAHPGEFGNRAPHSGYGSDSVIYWFGR